MKSFILSLINYINFFKKQSINLSIEDTFVLKAISIIMVVFHNYWHRIFLAPGENEQTFSPAVIARVFNALINNPVDFIHPLASFFGHYGVHIFIFLSGYGLAKKLILSKYSLNTISIYKTIIFKQIYKILKLVFVGFLFLILIKAWQLKNFQFFNIDFFMEFLRFCTFSQNFRPNQLYPYSLCSVWWFLSLIFQLYLLFPILVQFINKYKAGALLFLFLLTSLCGIINNQIIANYKIYVFATPLAQALPFAFGIFCAMNYKLPKLVYFIAFIIFPLSWKYSIFFPYSFIFIIMIVIYMYINFKKLICCKLLIYIGQLSMYIYITHGNIRWPIISFVNKSQSMYISYKMFFKYIIICFLVAWLCKYIVQKLKILK